jgi:hypothetical protein
MREEPMRQGSLADGDTDHRLELGGEPRAGAADAGPSEHRGWGYWPVLA